MVKLTIDNREVTVEPGATLLDAARTAGIDVPTLCYCEGLRPNTTCMVCVVKVRNGAAGKLVPACATRAAEGMIVESESAEVRLARKTSLELLLSDHAAECHAPCQFADPFDTDIPRMIRAVAADRLDAAIVILRDEMPLAGILTHVVRETCEGGCRRCAIDEAAAIGLLKRYVTDKDRAAATQYVPPRATTTGQRAAIVGSGPAGLTAAYFLVRFGHDCTVFEQSGEIGESLRGRLGRELPSEILDAEIELLKKMGVDFETGQEIDCSGSRVSADVCPPPRCPPTADPAGRTFADLRKSFDAVLIATGKAEQRVSANSTTHATDTPGVFAAGDVVRAQADAARAAADGKAAAFCVDQYLRGVAISGREKLFALGTGRPSNEEIASLMIDTDASPRVTPTEPNGDLSDEQARLEARRCLHCDCRSLETCKLRLYAERYGAEAKRFKGARRPMERIVTHPEIVYEPGKCIVCGICVQITEQLRDALGLTYIGRGFDVRVAVPFDERLDAALRNAARRCVENCPTGALAWRTERAFHT